MKIILYNLIVIFFVLSCKKEKIEDLKTTVQYKTVTSVSNDLLELDIYSKDSKTLKPIVIYVHGGGWSIGDKDNKIEDKVNLFLDNDYLFISINYRLSPFPYQVNNSDRITHPTHSNDVADAIKWIYENAVNYGGDKNKIGLIGHSAGAHLVSLIGTDFSYLENVGVPTTSIKGVVSIDAGGYNVYDQVRFGETINMYINAFGEDSLLNQQASPTYNVRENPNLPPFLIAKRGTDLHLQNALQFIDSLNFYNASVTVIDGDSYTHAEINEAIGGSNDEIITQPILDFFETCFQ